VALVGGSGFVATDDLYPLLRRRLLILTTIVACTFFIGLCIDLLLRATLPTLPGQARTASEWVINNWRAFLQIGVAGTSAIVLWRRPPRSVSGLRLIEVMVVGALVMVALFLPIHPQVYGDLQRGAQDSSFDIRQAFVVRHILAGALVWFITITVYGTLIPNTWRRCAAIASLMAVSPLVLFAMYAFWLEPLPATIAVQIVFVQGFYNSLAVAVAIFSSSRIEILRRQATEARKLGQYVLKEKLGSGGMGEVYRAEHALLRRPCALKVIRPERAGDPKNLRRFEREVQVTATLTHPNTVQIFDYGHTEDGTFYYVMEYLPGKNLEALVKETGPLPPDRVVHLLRQVCGALREAHAAGLIHRDIKPSNIIVCERGGLQDVAKLLDFGIVDAPEAGPGGELTAQGQLLGTPLFMSAEQAAGMPNLEARSDLYSLGATAYFVLTGKAPFERATTNLVIAAHLRDPVTPPHHLRTEVPADLSAVIQRCLEKDPSQRYPDAASLEKALAECKCAGEWGEDRAVQANRAQAGGDSEPRISTTELERRWSI
jgi:serine/threonine-protein kinase